MFSLTVSVVSGGPEGGFVMVAIRTIYRFFLIFTKANRRRRCFSVVMEWCRRLRSAPTAKYHVHSERTWRCGRWTIKQNSAATAVFLQVINHSENFVDPDDARTIERLWRDVKKGYAFWSAPSVLQSLLCKVPVPAQPIQHLVSLYFGKYQWLFVYWIY